MCSSHVLISAAAVHLKKTRYRRSRFRCYRNGAEDGRKTNRVIGTGNRRTGMRICTGTQQNPQPGSRCLLKSHLTPRTQSFSNPVCKSLQWQKSCCFLALLCKEFHLWSLRHPWISSIISSSYHRIPIFRANRRLMGDVWEASGVLTADGNSGYSCAPMKKNDWGWRCQLVSPTPNQAPPPKGKKSRNI